ncbi:lysylphosphatidylglycerol synthase domain-containing protein [Lysobacter sp. A286]
MTLRQARSLLSWATALGFVVWAVHLLNTQSTQLPQLSFGYANTTTVFLSTLAVIAVNGAIAEQAARRTGRSLAAALWVSIGFASIMLNYFLPLKAGSLFRLTAYVRLAGQDMLQLAASLLMSTLLIQAVFAALLVAALIASQGAAGPAIWALVLAATAVIAILLVVRSGVGKWPFLGRLRAGIVAWVNAGPGPFFVLVLLALLLLGFTVLRYWAVGRMIGLPLELGVLTIIACVSSLSALIGVTFGGLGVREAAIIIAAHLSGMQDTDALAFALLDRVLVSAIILPFGMLCIRYVRAS